MFKIVVLPLFIFWQFFHVVVSLFKALHATKSHVKMEVPNLKRGETGKCFIQEIFAGAPMLTTIMTFIGIGAYSHDKVISLGAAAICYFGLCCFFSFVLIKKNKISIMRVLIFIGIAIQALLLLAGILVVRENSKMAFFILSGVIAGPSLFTFYNVKISREIP